MWREHSLVGVWGALLVLSMDVHTAQLNRSRRDPLRTQSRYALGSRRKHRESLSAAKEMLARREARRNLSSRATLMGPVLSRRLQCHGHRALG